MDLPDRAHDVLTQRTRARLFEELSELRRPAGTEEMAERLELHPNGVRLHLERMLDAGLLERHRSRQSVGRPRDMWSIAAGAQPGGAPPHAYAELGRWLAGIVSSGKTSQRAVEAAGKEIGRRLAPSSAPDSSDLPAGPDELMRTSLASMGFSPTQSVEPSGALSYRLCNCPYRDVARDSRQVVCTLHRGVTLGLLEMIAPTTELTEFVARDPDTAGCLIELRGGLATTAAERESTESDR
ncbi:helix-turn-helix transcriptional regulator [Paraconexibacter sp.]|uniref:helix-turn-helix transcriptional regulator n=1 Tax=Paraconexibacter sp. TaxID=2949640 RepID=UPI0035696FE6